MVNGISSTAAVEESVNTQTDPVPTTAQSTKPAAPEVDTVKLSATAQAKLMLHQDMSVKQIAANLGMTVQALSNFLDLTTTSTAAPAAVPQATSAKE